MHFSFTFLVAIINGVIPHCMNIICESHVQLCIMAALLVPAVHYGRSISAPHTVHVNMNIVSQVPNEHELLSLPIRLHQ